LRDYIALAREELKLATLVEVHGEKELEAALDAKATMIGINNRDLDTFKVTLETTARLRGLIPADRIVVSESGISTREDIVLLQNMKVDAALIGEELVKAPDPTARIKELRGA
jgi:indole-3-glycerol phosphate synthase